MGLDVRECELALRAATEVIEESCDKTHISMIRETKNDKILMKTVRFKESVYNRLAELTVGKERFDKVITKLLDCYEQSSAVQEQVRIAKTLSLDGLTVMESSGLYSNKATKTIRITLSVYDRLGWLGSSKDTLGDVVERMLDSSCEKKMKEEIIKRLV